ncbi:tigger transposable element-derived protein 6-like [Mercenaria mercenaria]|uniref:tigger transposable element-derived protein 6-like n=1 Tax=Mercenaria mercenaria TaxID=6596 RepID=UPI00234F1A76|nr:tigger transposable element-derived protein 6-like [Mercenaria mercenaria]
MLDQVTLIESEQDWESDRTKTTFYNNLSLAVEADVNIRCEGDRIHNLPLKKYVTKMNKLNYGVSMNDNQVLVDWAKEVQIRDLSIIQEKARRFALELGYSDLKAADGWLRKWTGRYSVKKFEISGESAGVRIEDVGGFKARIQEFIGDYDMKDEFSCDETGLYYRALPDKTLSVRGSSTKGTKVSKERITVMFTCSTVGEKLEPLVIRKFETPRCYKKKLGVKYVANKKAWMNNQVFKTWIEELNSKGTKILLMQDNATSHGKDDDNWLSNALSFYQRTQRHTYNHWTRA